MPQNRRSRRVTFRDPIAAGARMVSKGGKLTDGGASWQMQRPCQSGRSDGLQRDLSWDRREDRILCENANL